MGDEFQKARGMDGWDVYVSFSPNRKEEKVFSASSSSLQGFSPLFSLLPDSKVPLSSSPPPNAKLKFSPCGLCGIGGWSSLHAETLAANSQTFG